ncbi:MAG: AAA family ATPase [Myxococcales bacterium]|nr:AAA family ATPase [Myxococcales bacterium]
MGSKADITLSVDPRRLRGRVDESAFRFSTTRELVDGQPALVGLTYQTRLRQALGLAAASHHKGLNVFASGPSGVHKSRAVLEVLKEEARRRATPSDWCYVFNFESPDRPRAIALPPGWGRRFAQDMEHFVAEVRRDIPRAFESEEYRRKHRRIHDELERRRAAVTAELQQLARQQGFVAELGPAGLAVSPSNSGGRPFTTSEFEALPAEARQRIEEAGLRLHRELESRLRQVRSVEKDYRQREQQLERDTALRIAESALEELRERYREVAPVLEYLEQVSKDVPKRLDELRSAEEEHRGALLAALEGRSRGFRHYGVNVLVDRGDAEGAPVVFETDPTFSNLCGTIDRRVEFGNLVTDFTLLRAGSLHRANGGYLVLFAEDLLRQLGSYQALKKSLHSQQVTIEDLASTLGLAVAQLIKPQPIPLDVRVVLVGPPLLYHLLWMLDPSFRKLFQVRADFDDQVDATAENLQAFARDLGALAREEGLLPLDRSGVARTAEHAMRIAEDKRKLSLRFGALAQLLHEANHLAQGEGASAISRRHLEAADEARRFRSSLPLEHLRELIKREVLIVRTAGEKVGQLNGLALSAVGEAVIGRPVRITAVVRPGHGELVDIERRAELGGRIHTKAVMILGGYLASRYAAELPLSLSAQLTFEQSYSEIEGDSASLGEALALLSAIGGFPLRQELAVTGSVSQAGEVQPVGGATDKIEAYFEVCQAVGLTGRQGVIVPWANLDHIHLRDEVVEAVRQGRFQVFAVRTVDQALELTSGLSAGEADKSGRFPPESANGRVRSSLERLASVVREYRAPSAVEAVPGHAARPLPPTAPTPGPEHPPGGPPPPPVGRRPRSK